MLAKLSTYIMNDPKGLSVTSEMVTDLMAAMHALMAEFCSNEVDFIMAKENSETPRVPIWPVTSWEILDRIGDIYFEDGALQYALTMLKKLGFISVKVKPDPTDNLINLTKKGRVFLKPFLEADLNEVATSEGD